MEDDYAEKRQNELVEDCHRAYGLIVAVLTHLPIPIGLEVISRDWDVKGALLAVDRARTELINDQPIGQGNKELLRTALLTWLTVYDLAGFIELAGPAPWRLDALEDGIRRTVGHCLVVASNLDIRL